MGLFLIALGSFLLSKGAIGGAVPFTREEKPYLFLFTVGLAICSGIFSIIYALING